MEALKVLNTPKIVEAVDALMESRTKVYPTHANRSSGIGDPCLRRLVYERTAWEQKDLPDLGLQYVFAIGNVMEGPVIRLIQDAGFTVSRTQEPFVYKSKGKTILTGHIDGVLTDLKGLDWVFDIKSMSPFIWDRIETIEDFQRYPWSKKYAPQMTAYMFGLEIPRGLFILVNKSTGRIKVLSIELDYLNAEALFFILVLITFSRAFRSLFESERE